MSAMILNHLRSFVFLKTNDLYVSIMLSMVGTLIIGDFWVCVGHRTGTFTSFPATTVEATLAVALLITFAVAPSIKPVCWAFVD